MKYLEFSIIDHFVVLDQVHELQILVSNLKDLFLLEKEKEV